MKILIADDDPVSRLVLEATLRERGHEVAAAGGGEAAWAAFEREAFDTVISDWLMPDLDGLALTRRIRAAERTRYTYVVLLTTRGGKASYLEGMQAGADDFVTKPLDPDELAARLRVAERMLGLQSRCAQLEGLLPICTYCKKIRDEGSAWVAVETYVAARTEASFSHGICPECYRTRALPEVERWKQSRG